MSHSCTFRVLGGQGVMVVSDVQERFRYRRVEGQEQLCGMELYPFLLTSRWVSLESFSTRWVSKEKD